MTAFDFEAKMECTECEYTFFCDLDEKPICPKCKGVKVEFVELDEPDPEA